YGRDDDGDDSARSETVSASSQSSAAAAASPPAPAPSQSAAAAAGSAAVAAPASAAFVPAHPLYGPSQGVVRMVAASDADAAPVALFSLPADAALLPHCRLRI